MHAYTNMTTRRLEATAKKAGVECLIKVIEAQEDGRYFVMEVGEEPLKQPVALGYTDEQAINCLKSRRWERYAMCAAPTRLGGTPQRRKVTSTGRKSTPKKRHYSW